MMPDVMPTTGPRNPTLPSASYRHPRTLRTALVLLALWAGLALYPGTREAFLSAGKD